MSVEANIVEMAKAARAASVAMAKCSSKKKNEVLIAIADRIEQQAAIVQKENQKDLVRAKEMGLSDAMIDRLAGTDATIKSMADGLKEVARLND
ncbi:MAG: gamma-glutamyl-phosphate reductase, partial [Desulfobacteraceae bacterium]|nr:gamma-glutamyl-phosphate reductase [Desulfobacteraceae bacterium]